MPASKPSQLSVSVSTLVQYHWYSISGQASGVGVGVLSVLQPSRLGVKYR